MVYKKYVKQNGKKFGPYYYESYRDSKGKVKSRFVSNSKKLDKIKDRIKQNKNFLILLLILLILTTIILISLKYIVKEIENRIYSDTKLSPPYGAQCISEWLLTDWSLCINDVKERSLIDSNCKQESFTETVECNQEQTQQEQPLIQETPPTKTLPLEDLKNSLSTCSDWTSCKLNYNLNTLIHNQQQKTKLRICIQNNKQILLEQICETKKQITITKISETQIALFDKETKNLLSKIKLTTPNNHKKLDIELLFT